MNNNDANKKLQELLSGLNPSALKNSKQSIEQLINSPFGKKLAGQLSNSDKQKLLNTFMGMDNNEIKNKLQNIKMSDLSGLSADEILKKLR